MEADDTTSEREALQRQAEEMEAVGMLARGVAHDFNNILSGILGFTSYLKSKAQPGSDLHRDLGLIEQAGVNAAELTHKLFLIARRRPGVHEPVVMSEIISDVVATLKEDVPTGVNLDSASTQQVPPVPGDPAQLALMVRNLLRRALSAVSEQGGRICVTLEARALNEHERAVLVNTESASYLCMRIEDSGRGISEEMRRHIFDPFYLTRTSREGPGLDMSVVYGVVANHLGNITVQSEEGVGTVFTVYLPVQLVSPVVHEPISKGDEEAGAPAARAQARPASAEGVAPENLRGTETVLVVDDERMVREIIEWMLAARGYKVMTASSGEDALRLYEKEMANVDLVLLDIMMPGMGGEEAFRGLRALNPDVPVLMTSIRAHEAVADRLIKQGARGVVYKPYKSNVLLTAVRSALRSPDEG